ncbi:DUF4097 family beta strand repeat-containing protein [Thermoactinospora rubra]|uniref:DUF4097 family beta strand repeat-containing protein n=1 Tax=Thermoactinospora rubra TaxID=1088767 RepID=UPI000A0FF727|nr:DUF4097 family beta strand repeat-containing protein [Thermoactinospora rubra]
MPQWAIDGPEKLTFGDVRTLNVRTVSGRLDVLASDGPPVLEVTDMNAGPLIVTHDEADGTLTVTYKDLSWEGLLSWLAGPRKRRCELAIAVPRTCAVNAGVVTASATVAGFERRTRVRSVSGEIVLDGVSGDVHAEAVSGSVESRAMEGDLSFKSVSGDLTVAGGTPRRLRANTVSGRITADLVLRPTSHVTINTVSGDVLVRLPHNVDTDVKVRSTSGQLDCAFDGLRERFAPGMRSLTGRLGDGMAALSATTVSGQVALLRGERR